METLGDSLEYFRETLQSPGVSSDEKYEKNKLTVIIVLGASGDLAKRKIYPTLWTLFRDDLLPTPTFFLGYARRQLTLEQVRGQCEGVNSMKVKPEQKDKYETFWSRNQYIHGFYEALTDAQKRQYMEDNRLSETPKGMEQLQQSITVLESQYGPSNRVFYLAVPPNVYAGAAKEIRNKVNTDKGFVRLVIEKPFGHDLDSSQELAKKLNSLFHEDQLYRIDHYLGKEMVQSVLGLRFGNLMFSPLWNRNYIASVLISFKEPLGTGGRAGYFDPSGIIRDIMQNHLMQILCMVAMEVPCNNTADSIRDEKVKVLKSIAPITLKQSVLGQYVGDPNGDGEARLGYNEEDDMKNNPRIKKPSKTPTYAMCVLNIENERWDGVPFILRAGKALNERKTEVRIQFSDVPGGLFKNKVTRNELVIRVQPDEAVYLKMSTKAPGMAMDMVETELDLTYRARFQGIKLPDAYERLLLDVMVGSQMHFVREDELLEAWRIFTPLLKESVNVAPVPYVRGTRGPKEADEASLRNNFKYYGTYKWTPPDHHL